VTSSALSRFLPAGRTEADRLLSQTSKLAASPIVTAVFQASGGAVAIVNEERLVVAVNEPFLDLLGEGAGAALGLRPGEALGCTRAGDGPDGCGTGAACASCGSALAMIAAEHRGRAEERDCTITVKRGDRHVDLDLRVRAAPFEVEGERYLLIGVTDVSDERRRQQLERSFSGSVYQQVSALRAAAAGLAEPHPTPATLAQLRQQIQQLDRTMQIQRALTAGVGGNVEPVPRTIAIAEELTFLAQSVERSAAVRGRRLEIVPPGPGEMMVVDSAMLQHVLMAMVLNALEATRGGGKARVEVDLSQAFVTFRVWNAGAIPAALVHRIFQRYFTTRGPGRGTGTWSMKVVGEEFMRGEVGFRTSELGGTTFWFTVPRRPFARA
jgi:signal transduction histidine kinase